MPRRPPPGSPSSTGRTRVRPRSAGGVVVRPGGRALAWSPPAAPEAGTVDRTRAAATRRARDVSLDLRVEGPVALWSHPVVPVLAGAALVDPERMLARIPH